MKISDSLVFKEVVLLALSTVILYCSWNMCIPELFKLPSITLAQSFWLVIITNVLIKDTYRPHEKD